MTHTLARRFDDIDIRLQRPIVSSTVLPAIEAIPGVRQVEAWGGGLVGVSMDPSVGMTRGRYGLLAPPTDTRMFKIPVVEGRWVTPRKTGEIVVNRNLQAREPTLVVGTDVYLSLGKRTVRGQVVGVIEEVSEPSVFTNETTFDELAGSSEAVGVIRVSTDSQAPADVAARIEDIIVDAGSMPALQFTRSALRQAMVDHFSILLALLLAASFSAIIVGGLALGTSMTLNVIERHREIGIVRALGAQSAAVRRLILTEGFVIAIVSICLAGLLSIPLTWGVTHVVGSHGLHVTLPFVFDRNGIIAWTVVVLMVTFIACLGPAKRAMTAPVREAIAYE